nr:hypothetical protein [Oxalobacteraceae bacterium]
MANGGGPFGLGDQILSGFLGDSTLRDYTHASRVFTTNSYELKPRFKFQFHVGFTVNTDQVTYLKNADLDFTELSCIVKTVDLPKFTVDTETLNQYNRKRIVQTKINYQPVTITFHDDTGDNARRLWYYYFSYYFKDATHRYNLGSTGGQPQPNAVGTTTAFDYNVRDIYAEKPLVTDWGFIGESVSDRGPTPSNVDGTGKTPFFKDIRIYGMDQNHKYCEYVLINPIITAWNHDTYDYAQGNGVMQHSMTIAYETVKYASGTVGAGRPVANMSGFADPSHYDVRRSPIARPGANATIFGQGGLLDAGIGIVDDLQKGPLGLIGAARTAMNTYNTFKGKNLKSIAINEAVATGNKVLGNAEALARTKPVQSVLIPYRTWGDNTTTKS